MADLVTAATALIAREITDFPTGSFGQSVLTDVKTFSFKGVVLAGSLIAWNDRIKMRLALHQYLKRDGAEVESQGREPGRFTMRLQFLGPQWAQQYRAFLALFSTDPKGEMVHPILGSLRVACEGVEEAGVVPGQEIDSIAIAVTFVEDAIDQIRLSDRFPGISTQQGNVTAAASSLVTAVAGFATSALLVAQLTADAITLAVAIKQTFGASGGASGGAADPSLDAQMASVALQVDAAIAAILADVAAAGDSDASAFPALMAAQQLYASLLAMVAAAAAARPALVVYVVPADTNVAVICATLYGAGALDRIDEVLRLNRIANPALIPAGTRLRVSAPTI